MPLLSLMMSDPTAVSQLSIEQIVATAGDGKLKDGTESQAELRGYLQQVSVETLASYVDYCLSNPFTKSGQVLQDVVNELGRKLEYEVTNGRYQGTSNSIGYDGIWRDPSGHCLVVEVKTTDAYRLSLDTLAAYRDKLVQQNTIAAPCSILIVVGRTDTGELEAQVRGSRHAWDIRLISVESLLNLVRVKESADNQETIAMIRRLLTPVEYTRLDKLVDVVFTTTKDVETTHTLETGTPPEMGTQDDDTNGFTPTEVIQNIRDRVVAALKANHGVNLVKKSRALLWDPSHSHRVVCTVSKRYIKQGTMKYWYAYHPQWHTFLTECEKGFFVLGCTDQDAAFALPVDVLAEHLDEFHTTTKADGSTYYHIKIISSAPDQYALQLPHNGGLDLSPYKVQLPDLVGC